MAPWLYFCEVKRCDFFDWLNRCINFFGHSSFLLPKSKLAQNALQREWGNFPFANWNGIFWGLLLQLLQLIEIHFLPHLESFMWEWKFEKKFFKKSLMQPPNGAQPICKLPFPNGSYRNGVCRGLWAISLSLFNTRVFGKK